jgi:hypothetical protein
MSNKIQNLLCTIQQGQKLKELGVTAESQWVQFMNGKYGMKVPTGYYAPDIGIVLSKEKIHGVINLYGLGELMRMLPELIEVRKVNNGWIWVNDINTQSGIYYPSPEQAAADYLIHLIKREKLTPSQCNAALKGE